MNEKLVRFGSAGLFVALVLEPGAELAEALHNHNGPADIEFTDEALVGLPARLPVDGHTHREAPTGESIRRGLEYYVSVSPPATEPVLRLRDTTGRVWRLPSELLPYMRVESKG